VNGRGESIAQRARQALHVHGSGDSDGRAVTSHGLDDVGVVHWVARPFQVPREAELRRHQGAVGREADNGGEGQCLASDSVQGGGSGKRHQDGLSAGGRH